MIETLNKFTYYVYVDFLVFLQSKYKIITFSDASETSCPYLILRHDIDASLEAALRMAKIENKMNIRSTYFVLFSHKLYNILETDSLNILREICELGHEIGLHYDLEAYEGYHRDLRETLEDEVHLLEKLLNKTVASISCHNPATLKGSDPFKEITGYINAYNTSMYDLYVSDSCRVWHLEDLRLLLELGPKRVQLVLHPILWTKNACGRAKVLEDCFDEIKRKNEKYKKWWIKSWNNRPLHSSFK